MATRPIISTSSVLRLRCTSTLSITTWKNSGEISANSCRKKEAINTSLSWRRYLPIAPRNQAMSKRRERSDNPARRAIRTRRPSQIASNSAWEMDWGRGARGNWTRILSSPARPRIRYPPSLSWAIAGIGVAARRCHVVLGARTLRPTSLAQRSISGTPTLTIPSWWRICSALAPMP